MTIGNNWDCLLKEEETKDYFKRLQVFLKEERLHYDIFPTENEVYRAFKECPPESVKVVIVGQDPYPTPGNANGLAFSVPEGVKPAASLKNIFKEIQAEFGGELRTNGDLSDWEKQGILLLNTVLTVRSGEPGSHRKKGWEEFTDAVLSYVALMPQPIAIMLWGADAQKKEGLFTNPKHLVIKTPHPSPLSARRGFFGSGCFMRANEWLNEHGERDIHWI